MLNQEKIGKYIAQKRKSLGFTQKQLGESVNLSDKAVSKWERGISMPDHEVVVSICQVLHITVNEFLAGEDILLEEYSDKAEENMISLIEDNKQVKRSMRWIVTSIGFGIGFICLFVAVYAMLLNIKSLSQIAFLIDLPSLLSVLGITMIVLTISGKTKDLLSAFQTVFGKDEVKNKSFRTKTNAVKSAMLCNLLAGILSGLIRIILTLSQYQQSQNQLSAISLSLLPIFYAVVFDLILCPFYFRLLDREEVEQ